MQYKNQIKKSHRDGLDYIPLVLRTLNVLALRASYLVLAPTYNPLVLLVAGRGTAQPSDSVRGPRNE